MDQYTTALRTLASTWQLADLTDSLALSRLICGLSNRAVKERLLRTRGLDLSAVIDACRAVEIAKDQLRVLDRAPEERIEPVQINAPDVVQQINNEGRKQQFRLPGLEGRYDRQHGERTMTETLRMQLYGEGEI